MTAPDLVALAGGRFAARCAFCRVESIPVAAVNPKQAWSILQGAGWVVYEVTPGAWLRALCKACGEKNAAILDAAKAAREGRKRK
jgi:hypothetical protein